MVLIVNFFVWRFNTRWRVVKSFPTSINPLMASLMTLTLTKQFNWLLHNKSYEICYDCWKELQATASCNCTQCQRHLEFSLFFHLLAVVDKINSHEQFSSFLFLPSFRFMFTWPNYHDKPLTPFTKLLKLPLHWLTLLIDMDVSQLWAMIKSCNVD